MQRDMESINRNIGNLLMNAKKILLGSLLAGGVLALVRLASARAHSVKPASKPSIYAAIDAYVEEQMLRLNIPGAALVIVEGEQVAHMRGFGRVRPGGEAPSPRTPFSIGSLTKSFTAMAVMQLVEAGKIALDAPVQRYLPWFCAQMKDSQAPAQVTVRHLLNQTGSLPLGPGWELSADFDERPGATERQALSLIPLKLIRPPGEAFEYSNLNFNLLGLIIEAASGESYPAYIQNHIFNPLEMHHSHTSKAQAKRDGLAIGHQFWFGIPVAVPDLPDPSGSLPSGQLISSVEDLSHYLIAYLNGGRYGEAQILSPESIGAMHHPAVETMMLGYERGWYGMGWYVVELGLTKAFHHSGLTPDFFAYMALLPEQKKGLAFLVNADHFMMQPMMAEVDAGLTRLLAGSSPEPIRLGIIPWLMRGLLLIPFLQFMDVVATLGMIRGWRKNPQRRPSQGRTWGRHVLLPLVPHLLASLTLIPALGPIRKFLMLFASDISWIARICGGFATMWIFLRTGLILRALHKNP